MRFSPLSLLVIPIRLVIGGVVPYLNADTEATSKNIADLSIRNSHPADYNKLVDYAHFASFAYCMKHGLTPGMIGDEGTNCPLQRCKYDQYKKVEIKRTFNFNGWGQVGSGYFAIDHATKRLLMVFRGTATITDWVSNMDFVPVRYNPLVSQGEISRSPVKTAECENCSVHRGFYNFVRRNSGVLIEGVLTQVDKYPDYQLVFVGHSLGAALATLIGMEFQIIGVNPLVITYGGPKVGNKEFSKFSDEIFDTRGVASSIYKQRDFAGGLIRVAHENDAVVDLPPTQAFEHGGFEYFIGKKKLPHTPEDVNRRGLSKRSYVEEDTGNVSAATISIGKLWPEYFSKYEHTHYFIRISGCNPEKEFD